ITQAGIGGAGIAIAVQDALYGAKEIRIFNIDDTAMALAKEKIPMINEKTDCKVTLSSLSDLEAFKQSIAESLIYIDATGVGMKPLVDQSLITD
ncbi:quinate/shikimate dehydrogenase, partial [Enterococcus faecalis]